MKSYKFRLRPSARQELQLNTWLSICCELYNAGLQERRDAYKHNGVLIGYHAQAIQLPEIKQARSDVAEINAQVLQDTLRRLSKTFADFFRRARRKEKKKGFPRFKPRARYDSFTFPQAKSGAFTIAGDKLRLSKIGAIKIILHRKVEGKTKTCTIKREAGRWYAILVTEVEAKPLPQSRASVGVDVGLSAFATLSDGTQIANPRWYRDAQLTLRRAQRKVARRNKGSHRRRKAVQLLQRAHVRIRQQRADFHHKVSRELVDDHGLIAVEALNIKGLASGMLAKSVNDAGWGLFIKKIAYKAENAGRQFLRVNSRGTSQICLCGASVPKSLGHRWHECSACGLSAQRDHVSAQIILGLGLSLQAPTWPTSACVA